MADDDAYDDYGGRGHSKSGNVKKVFKVLCPETLMAKTIGTGGAVRKEIEEATGATLRMSQRNEYYPGTRNRLMSVTADHMDKVLDVLNRIVDFVNDLAGEESQNGKSAGKSSRDDSETFNGKEPGEIVFRCALPAACSGALIGPSGARIKALRQKTGAKVFVENETHDGHQMARVIGPQDAISAALIEVCEVLETEVPEDKIARWASVMSFEGGKGGGKGGKGNKGGNDDRDRDRDRDRNHERGSGGGRDHDRGSGGGRAQDHWDGDRGSGGGRGRSRSRRRDHGGHGDEFRSNLDAITSLSGPHGGFPPGALEMPHQISCDLPNERVGGLIGRKGECINHVQKSTGAKIVFSEAPKNTDAPRTMTITGDPLAVYAAHMMMMKKYHQDQYEEENKRRQEEEQQRRHEDNRHSSRKDDGWRNQKGGAQRGGAEADVNDLQNQLADLQKQLDQAQSQNNKRKGGGKGH